MTVRFEKMGKGLAYSVAEDAMIIAAGLRAGEDPIVGADQKKEMYMQRMFKNYQHVASVSLGEEVVKQRTPQGIRQRYQKIKENCRVFHGKVRQVKQAKVSGFDFHIMSDAEILKIATFLFNSLDDSVLEAARKVASGEVPSPPFLFTDCYKQLRDSPGFTASDSDPCGKVFEVHGNNPKQDVVDICNEPIQSKVLYATNRMDSRPMGRKRAKLCRYGENSSEELQAQTAAGNESAIARIASIIERREDRYENDAAMIAIKKQEIQLRIAEAPDQDPEVRKEILKLLTEGVLADLRASGVRSSKEKTVHAKSSATEPETMQSSPDTSGVYAEDFSTE